MNQDHDTTSGLIGAYPRPQSRDTFTLGDTILDRAKAVSRSIVERVRGVMDRDEAALARPHAAPRGDSAA